jgi:hypothetical protein
VIDIMKPAFQPAPRPRPRTSLEEAQQFTTATGDLGFTRASTAPEQVAPAAELPQPSTQVSKSPIAPSKSSALKFEVPDEVWLALRQEALNRRVTVKYLVLEALAAKGYNVDLAAVPEDGRRLR